MPLSVKFDIKDKTYRVLTDRKRDCKNALLHAFGENPLSEVVKQDVLDGVFNPEDKQEVWGIMLWVNKLVLELRKKCRDYKEDPDYDSDTELKFHVVSGDNGTIWYGLEEGFRALDPGDLFCTIYKE